MEMEVAVSPWYKEREWSPKSIVQLRKKKKLRFLVVSSLTLWLWVFPEVQNKKQFVSDSFSHFIDNHFLKPYPWYEGVWELPFDTFKKTPDFTPVLMLLIISYFDDVSSIFSSLPWKTVYKVTFCQCTLWTALGCWLPLSTASFSQTWSLLYLSHLLARVCQGKPLSIIFLMYIKNTQWHTQWHLPLIILLGFQKGWSSPRKVFG